MLGGQVGVRVIREQDVVFVVDQHKSQRTADVAVRIVQRGSQDNLLRGKKSNMKTRNVNRMEMQCNWFILVVVKGPIKVTNASN